MQRIPLGAAVGALTLPPVCPESGRRGVGSTPMSLSANCLLTGSACNTLARVISWELSPFIQEVMFGARIR